MRDRPCSMVTVGPHTYHTVVWHVHCYQRTGSEGLKRHHIRSTIEEAEPQTNSQFCMTR